MSAEIGANERVDVRPVGITDKQDAIIQHVAEFVVNSCDSAKYQHKLRTMTKHNAYFNFLDPSHVYYTYYEYLLQSYRYWKEVEAAAKASGGTAAMIANMNNNNNEPYDINNTTGAAAYDGNVYNSDYGYYNNYNNDYYNNNNHNNNEDQMQLAPNAYAPQEYIQGDMYNYNYHFQSTGDYHPTWYNNSNNGALDGVNKTSLYPPSAPELQQQQEYSKYYSNNYTSYHDAPSSYSPSGYYDENATNTNNTTAAPLSNAYANTVFTPTNLMCDNTGRNVDVTQYAPESVYEKQVQEQQVQEQHVQVQSAQTKVEQHNEEIEEDEDEEYEMIIENGVQKLVPRRREDFCNYTEERSNN